MERKESERVGGYVIERKRRKARNMRGGSGDLSVFERVSECV